MASVRLSKKGKLFFDFYYRNVRCREYTLLNDTVANRRLMAATMKRIESEIAAGTFSYRRYFPTSKRANQFEPLHTPVAPPSAEDLSRAAAEAEQKIKATGMPAVVAAGSSPLFPAFANQWYGEREIDWKRSQRRKVSDILAGHLVPRFKGRRVGDISKEDILAFRTHLAKDVREGQGLSPSRINGVLNVLRQILEEAADRFQFTMPFRGIRPLRVQKTKVDPFTLEEVQLILGKVPPAFEPYYTVAFFTGMRTSELLGLKWPCVDFARNQILVRETLVDNELDTPKTEGSNREIAISTPVLAVLKRQQALTADIDSEFVFCAGNGAPLSRHNLAHRVWAPTLKALGLRHRPPYQTRHTAATLWLAAGEAPEWIAKQMGHTSTKMLFTVYSRYVPNLTRKDGSMFELLVGARFAVAQAAQPEGESHARG